MLVVDLQCKTKTIEIMTEAKINTEIKKVKNIMDNLMRCIEDLNVSSEDRKQYYKEYLESSVYYLKLNQCKPEHNLSIA